MIRKLLVFAMVLSWGPPGWSEENTAPMPADLEKQAAAIKPAPAAGPLQVHPTNPRYFTDGTKRPGSSLKAVYLTGSHNWDNFQRWFEGEVQQKLTAGKLGQFADYLDVLQKHQHNFIRLWVADTAWSPITQSAIEPQPYVRTGPVFSPILASIRELERLQNFPPL